MLLNNVYRNSQYLLVIMTVPLVVLIYREYSYMLYAPVILQVTILM